MVAKNSIGSSLYGALSYNGKEEFRRRMQRKKKRGPRHRFRLIFRVIAWKYGNKSLTLPLNSATNERRAELAPAMPNEVRNAKISNRSHKFLIVDLVVSRREGYPPTFSNLIPQTTI